MGFDSTQKACLRTLLMMTIVMFTNILVNIDGSLRITGNFPVESSSFLREFAIWSYRIQEINRKQLDFFQFSLLVLINYLFLNSSNRLETEEVASSLESM